ncbi:thaumatin-like protein [Oryza glaberrima]|uniref:thaumatin-like protein n=1 Tax=Oryza glaberrima TaxID=4538 RepID=UPI00023E4060|nr:thaumatin-like protein [Oryza glaberrima]
MASPAAASSSALAVVLLVMAAMSLSANAATFAITNQCPYTVWPAATPVGGGVQLNPGDTWTIDVPAGTSSGRVWGRTGCNFNGGSGSCATGDCGGALSCALSGQPPLTLVEFTLAGAAGGDQDQDYYNLSVIDGFNVGISIGCSSGETLTCREKSCHDAYQYPSDDTKVRTCSGDTSYQIVFCP